MPLKSPLSEFCARKGIDGQTKSAFAAFIRASYADKFEIKESGETVHVLLNQLSQEDLEVEWINFVKHFAHWINQHP